MFRSLFAILAGLITGGIIIAGFQYLGSYFFADKGTDLFDDNAMKEFIDTAPSGAYVFSLISYAAGAFVAGFTATSIVKNNIVVPALFTGVIFMILCIVHMMLYPYPDWFWVICLTIFIPFSWLGYKVLFAIMYQKS